MTLSREWRNAASILYACKKEKGSTLINPIKNFCHGKFNKFAFTPSIGNSGGIITVWNGNIFDGVVISQNLFQITVEFKCKMSEKNLEFDQHLWTSSQ
jgi:hypothetical protein